VLSQGAIRKISWLWSGSDEYEGAGAAAGATNGSAKRGADDILDAADTRKKRLVVPSNTV